MDNEQDGVYTFFHSIATIYLKMRKISESKLQELNLTYPQFGVLSTVYASQNIIQKSVAERLHTDTTTIMVICDSLEKKNLIQRISSKNDRRAKMLVLTSEGENVVTTAFPLVMDLYKSALNVDSKAQLDNSLKTLNLIIKNINEIELNVQKDT